MLLGRPGISQFTSMNFHIIPDQICWYFPGGKTPPKSPPGKFTKILHFIDKLTSPHQVTETGCLNAVEKHIIIIILPTERVNFFNAFTQGANN